ncbi:thiamine pyrophosphokinase [Desulfosarcina ovata subsp. sediminis]|uniref:Thiamine diphosphokinase n=1 Tax=Desulfosarcina ovata subsp. sediminis TaxID=885957 RepID=A0A5K8A0S4_9BACT|nr:thiamine diphosphokinase [Desulfosarcina ovata]BBO85930.1 thiamine pyrophosphokinase [Desulfosarcina ovata subsp. sediminis]
MIRAIVFANGVMDRWPVGLTLSADRDLIIAADGGLAHCRRWGVTPHVVVGDMDSIDPGELADLEKTATEIIRHPVRKNETDLELALKLAIDRGAEEIAVLGALGARWDMTFSNVLLLGAEFLSRTTVRLLDGVHELCCLQGSRQIRLRGRPGDLVSLLPISGNATGVSLKGLAYPLTDASLPFGTSHGVSNVFTGETASVTLKEGMLLVSITRAAGGPF